MFSSKTLFLQKVEFLMICLHFLQTKDSESNNS